MFFESFLLSSVWQYIQRWPHCRHRQPVKNRRIFNWIRCMSQLCARIILLRWWFLSWHFCHSDDHFGWNTPSARQMVWRSNRTATHYVGLFLAETNLFKTENIKRHSHRHHFDWTIIKEETPRRPWSPLFANDQPVKASILRTKWKFRNCFRMRQWAEWLATTQQQRNNVNCTPSLHSGKQPEGWKFCRFGRDTVGLNEQSGKKRRMGSLRPKLKLAHWMAALPIFYKTFSHRLPSTSESIQLTHLTL